MGKVEIKIRTVPLDEIPVATPVPEEWLAILESGEAIEAEAKYRSAIYQRFRAIGRKIKTRKVGNKLYFWLAEE